MFYLTCNKELVLVCFKLHGWLKFIEVLIVTISVVNGVDWPNKILIDQTERFSIRDSNRMYLYFGSECFRFAPNWSKIYNWSVDMNSVCRTHCGHVMPYNVINVCPLLKAVACLSNLICTNADFLWMEHVTLSPDGYFNGICKIAIAIIHFKDCISKYFHILHRYLTDLGQWCDLTCATQTWWNYFKQSQMNNTMSKLYGSKSRRLSFESSVNTSLKPLVGYDM